MIRLLRPVAFGVLFLGLSGCCCCDPAALQQYGEAVGMQDQFEAKMKEEMAKAEAEMAKAQAEQEKAMAELQKTQVQEQEPAQEMAKPEPTPAVVTGGAVDPSKIAGKFKDNALDKKALTQGSLKLDVDDKKKVTGRFLGQYHRKPFSIALEGKLKADNSFELVGKDAESDITVSGNHGGESLSGKITGRVKGKAIAADFAAKRY